MDSHADPDPQVLLAHMGWMRALARRLVTDQHKAEDLAQDAYVIALRRAPSDPARLRPWLGGVLRKLALKTESKESPQPLPERAYEARTGAELRSAASVTERAEAQRLLVQIVLQLDVRHRQVVLEHYFADKSLRSIARELGEPESNVRRRLNDAHEVLRRDLGRQLGPDPAEWSMALLGLPLHKVVPASTSGAGALFGGKLLIAGLFLVVSVALTFLVVRIASSGSTVWSPDQVEAAGPRATQSPTTPAEAPHDLRSVSPIPEDADAGTAPAQHAAGASVDPEPPAPALTPTLSDASYDRLLAAIESTLDGQIDLGALIGLSQELFDAVDLIPGTQPVLGPDKRLSYNLPTSFDSLTAAVTYAETTNPAVNGPAISLRLELAPRNGVLHTVNGVVRLSGILEIRPLNDAEGHLDRIAVLTDLMPAGRGLNPPLGSNPGGFRSRGVNLTFDAKSPGNTSGIVHGMKESGSFSTPVPLTLVGSTPTQADLERFAARLNELLTKARR